MKMDMECLANRLMEYDRDKRDFISDSSAIQYSYGKFRFEGKPVEVTPTALSQLLSRYDVPAEFFKDILTHRERATLFNRLCWENRGGEHKLYRFNGNTLYGVVSDRYRKLDNILILDLLSAGENSGLRFKPVKVHLDPDHTKIRLVPDGMGVGDITPMVEITNSENGNGSLQVWGGVFRWVCSNGMIVPVGRANYCRWVHIGGDDFQVPDLSTVLNVSMDYMKLLDSARTIYVSAEKKSFMAGEISRIFDRTIAESVISTANREYNSGRTMFDVVNSITRAAQSFGGKKQTDMERYAASLLAA